MNDSTLFDVDIDRKYKIIAENPCSGNKHTEKDSVLFLAKDKAFLTGALPGYRAKCVELNANPAHIESIDLLIERVAAFQENIASKVPDTDLPCEIRRCVEGKDVDSSPEMRHERFFTSIESAREVVKATGIDIITRYFNSIDDESKMTLCNMLDSLIFDIAFNTIKAVRLILMEIKLISTVTGSVFKLTDTELAYVDQQLALMARLK